MKVLCQGVDGVCTQCQLPIKPRVKRTCQEWSKTHVSEPLPPVPKLIATEDCPHFSGQPTGDSVLVYGTGCSSERSNGVMLSVYSCSKHGRCVPCGKAIRLEDETIILCRLCLTNPANQALRK